MKLSITVLENALSKELIYKQIQTDKVNEKIESYIANMQKAKDNNESEEHFKNILNKFLLNVFPYKINTHKRIDAVIKENDDIKVIIEVKRPDNQAEMIQQDNANKKAFHEALLYYYEQKQNNVFSINYILITDCEKFYLINAKFFEELINNKQITSLLDGFKNKSLNIIRTTSDLYNALSPVLDSIDIEVPAIFVDIADNNLNTEYFYKLFCEYYLFNKHILNDSNALNMRFYNELLYILGLKEDDKSNLVPSKIKNTLLDITEEIVKGKTPKVDIFETALSLNILWLNRILFLKLLESQLKTVRDDKDFTILNPEYASNPPALYNLFFNVLNKTRDKRTDENKEKYKYIPYLNSSLFEHASIEREYEISSLNNECRVIVMSNSILGRDYLKKEIPVLEYLLRFLNCYQFNREEEGSDPNTVIKSSVLGLVFERLNAYKDGSVYTPSSITMYMCSEVIQKQAVKLYNKEFNIKCKNFDELINYAKQNFYNLENREKALSIINAITIIDPAVGSGHFLVSCLNELIYIKSSLGLLGNEIKVNIENDELVITYTNGKPFIYKKENNAITDVEAEFQKLIFDTKKYIIEKQIFGVDKNPNSVNICRLRLWIELLKHSYYTDKKLIDMEVLPNLEFKVITANSLLPLAKDQTGLVSVDYGKLRSSLSQELMIYFNSTKDKEDIKDNILKIIDEMKKITVILEDSQDQVEQLKKYSPFDTSITTPFFDSGFMFGIERFDIVIMNPPYISLQTLPKKNNPYQDIFDSYRSTGDMYQLFLEHAFKLIKCDGIAGAIVSNKWMRAGYGESTRLWLNKKAYVYEIVDLGADWFDSATVDTNIIVYEKLGNRTRQTTIDAYTLSKENKDIKAGKSSSLGTSIATDPKGNSFLILNEAERKILDKVNKLGKPLQEWDISIKRGILTGYNEAFIIDKETRDKLIKKDEKSKEIIKPILRGRDIKRYSYNFADLYLIATFPSLNIKIDNYKAVKEYLKKFGKRIEQIGEEGTRKKTSNKWFETQDQIWYYKDFEKPKIIYSNMTQFLPFLYEDKKFYTNQKCFIITNNIKNKNLLKYMTGFFNSKLSYFWIRRNCAKLGKAGIELSSIFFVNIPIPVPTKEQEDTIAALVDTILTKKENNTPTLKEEKEIDKIVYKLYKITKEEIDIVEAK